MIVAMPRRKMQMSTTRKKNRLYLLVHI